MKKEFCQISREVMFTDWYRDARTALIMLHLILHASFDPDYKRRDLHRNEVRISLNSLAGETGLSVKQVREGINKLLYMEEIEKYVTGQDCTYTVVNFDEYTGADADG